MARKKWAAGAALLLGGCAAWLAPPTPPPAPAAAPEPAPPRCAPFAAGPAEVPPVSALRAVLGAREHSDELDALAAKLGGTPRVYAAEDGLAYDFPDRGVRLTLLDRGAGPRVHKVELLARMEAHASYAGALPDGLRFDEESEAVDRTLGGNSDFGGCIGPECTWRARGLTIEYAGACIGAIALVEEAAPGTVRVAELAARTGAVVEDEHGLQLAVTLVVGRDFPDPKAHTLGASPVFPVDVRLTDGAGAELARQSAYLSNIGEHTETIFVPYRKIKLAPGPTRVRVEVTSRAAPLISAAPFDVAFEMPKRVQVRVAVAHVEVEPGVYDNTRRTSMILTVITGGAIPPYPGPKRWERPDLFWTVSAPGEDGSPWRSSVHEDVYAASWHVKGPWVTIAAGDPLDVCVEDEDPGSAEYIACIRLPPEELRAAAAAHRALSQDQVKRLVLGSVEIR